MTESKKLSNEQLEQIRQNAAGYYGEGTLALEVTMKLLDHIAAVEADHKAELKLNSENETTRLNEFWSLVYPDTPMSWEYPAQVYRHVRDLIDEKSARIESLEGAIRRAVDEWKEVNKTD